MRRCCALVGCLAISRLHYTPPCKQQMWQEGQGVCFLWMKKQYSEVRKTKRWQQKYLVAG